MKKSVNGLPCSLKKQAKMKKRKRSARKRQPRNLIKPGREDINMQLPKDPVILLSYVNTALRDRYRSLKDFCEDTETDMIELCTKLDQIDYHYSLETNRFV